MWPLLPKFIPSLPLPALQTQSLSRVFSLVPRLLIVSSPKFKMARQYMRYAWRHMPNSEESSLGTRLISCDWRQHAALIVDISWANQILQNWTVTITAQYLEREVL